MMARPGCQLAVAQCPHLPAQRRLGNDHTKFLPKPLAQVDEAPADHALDGRDWPILDRLDQCRTVTRGQAGRLPRRLAIDQPCWSLRVELDDPIANDLQSDAADRRRLCPARTLINRSQLQQAPSLRAVFRLFGQRPQLRGIEIGPQWDRHGKLHGSPS